MKKIFYIVDDNGLVKDTLIGEENRQVANSTLKYINSEEDWVRNRIVELDLIGRINDGFNILTTIKRNNIPCKSIINNLFNVPKIVGEYTDKNDDYNTYTYSIEKIELV